MQRSQSGDALISTRTGDAAALAGYCGASDRLDRALAEFALAYAAQTVQDHAALVNAINTGRLPVAF